MLFKKEDLAIFCEKASDPKFVGPHYELKAAPAEPAPSAP